MFRRRSTPFCCRFNGGGEHRLRCATPGYILTLFPLICEGFKKIGRGILQGSPPLPRVASFPRSTLAPPRFRAQSSGSGCGNRVCLADDSAPHRSAPKTFPFRNRAEPPAKQANEGTAFPADKVPVGTAGASRGWRDLPAIAEERSGGGNGTPGYVRETPLGRKIVRKLSEAATRGSVR